MRIQAMNMLGINANRSDFIGMVPDKSGAINDGRMLQGFSKALRGPGLRRNSYVLSDSLREKLNEARHALGVEAVPEKETTVEVAKTSDPSPIDWAYLRRSREELFPN